MSFEDILEETERAEEKVTLLKRQLSQDRDEFNRPKFDFVEEKIIRGVIQRDQETKVDYNGTESEPTYRGYFLPTFKLETAEINEYRVKYEKPNKTLIMKILHYNPNLYEGSRHDQIVLDLILEKKYASR